MMAKVYIEPQYKSQNVLVPMHATRWRRNIIFVEIKVHHLFPLDTKVTPKITLYFFGPSMKMLGFIVIFQIHLRLP